MIYSDICSFTPFIHSLPTAFKWTLPDPVLETVEPPISLFEKLFTDDITKFICEESVRYAISKGNHSFTIDTNMLKAFIAILLASGYVDLPRRTMYWEHNEDTHNTTVSSLCLLAIQILIKKTNLQR